MKLGIPVDIVVQLSAARGAKADVVLRLIGLSAVRAVGSCVRFGR
jgi:hypothetical protein